MKSGEITASEKQIINEFRQYLRNSLYPKNPIIENLHNKIKEIRDKKKELMEKITKIKKEIEKINLNIEKISESNSKKKEELMSKFTDK